MAWNRDEYKMALRKRLGELAKSERRKETIGSIPLRSIDPLIDVATEVAARLAGRSEPGSLNPTEAAEVMEAGNRVAAKLAGLVNGSLRTNIAPAQRTEIRRLLGAWDMLRDEDDDEELDDDDDEDEPVTLTAHPHLRVKDWEQIWYVMTRGQIKDYDGFTDVGVDETMTVEEFMRRCGECTVTLNRELRA